jgi:beta-lactam-binding protein with PASTA domain
MSMEPTTIGGGRYELSGMLGRGGMAEVRQARDLRLGRTVAIKRLRTDLASDPTFQARFRREAQSAASLNHPAIVAVYDTGEELATDGTGLMLPYIVMEYVEGRTLRDILREGRRILPERALEITGSVLDALDYSHRAGIIHRDIKPANVMLTPSGDVKVMDFGIARAIADSSATMTQTAAVVGTAQYLSPEQARGEQVDARSDLYSAGCLLFELLTGRPPFIGDSPVSVAYQHVREEAQAPSTIDRSISPDIDAITLKALSKRVDGRYQSASEMRADIDRTLEGRPVMAPAVYGAAAGQETEHFLPPAPNEGAHTAATTAIPPEEPPKKRTALWVTLLLLLVAAVVAALIFIPDMLKDDPPTQTEVPRVAGLTVKAAEKAITDANLVVGEKITENSSEVPKNHVIRQEGATPGEMVDEGTEIDLVISAGQKTAVVQDVTGMTLRQATTTLEGLGFTVNPIEDPKSPEAKNVVTRQDPAAGTTQPVNSTIDVYYSTGPVTVPSVVGSTKDEATQELEALGFKVVASNVVSDADKDTVVAQDPEGGSEQPYGTTIVIDVSLGPTETTTPPTEPTDTSTSPPPGDGG